MRTTIDFPEDLYHRIKARSEREGRSIRSVAIELFQERLHTPAEPTPQARAISPEMAPWLAITRRYIRPGMSHGMNSIHAAIAKGWAEEAMGKMDGPS